MSMKRISQEAIYDNGFFQIVKSKVHESSLNIDFERIHVKHVGAISIIPVLDDGDILLIKQYRATIDKFSLEAVAGRRDIEGEDLLECANRELEEEVGYSAQDIAYLGWLHTSPGYTDEVIHLYMATSCLKLDTNKPDGYEEVFAETVKIDIQTAINWITDGTITDAKTIINIYRVAEKLGYSLKK